MFTGTRWFNRWTRVIEIKKCGSWASVFPPCCHHAPPYPPCALPSSWLHCIGRPRCSPFFFSPRFSSPDTLPPLLSNLFSSSTLLPFPKSPLAAAPPLPPVHLSPPNFPTRLVPPREGEGERGEQNIGIGSL